MRITVTIKHPQKYKRLLTKLRQTPDDYAKSFLYFMGQQAQARARVRSPKTGVTGHLAQSIEADRKVDTLGSKHTLRVAADRAEYAKRVHEGGIPDPSAGRGETSIRGLERWILKNYRGGLRDRTPRLRREAIGLALQLRTIGIRRPTPFFILARNDVGKPTVKRKADDKAFKAMERKFNSR